MGASETCGDADVGVLIGPINTFERPGCLTTLTVKARDTVTRVGHPDLGI
jgi:hydroxypyruvate isomerase